MIGPGRAGGFSSRRFRAVLLKEFRHIWRDVRTLLLVILAPPLLLWLLANIFQLDSQRARFAVWDLDNSPTSRRYTAMLTSDGDFTLVRYIHSEAEIEPLLQSGEAAFILILPDGFSDYLLSGRPSEIQAVFDGSDAIRAPQALGALEQRTQAFNQQILLQGRSLPPAPLTMDYSVWYNPSLKSAFSMVPGLIPIVMTMPALAFALSLARERELGSFEGLIATPVQGPEYLLGKGLAYIVLGLAGIFLTWGVAVIVFSVPFRGSFLLYVGLSIIYLAATNGIVMALSRFIHSQQIALFVILLYFFVPSFFVGGLVLPPPVGPEKIIPDIIPTTHFIVITRSLFLKALPLSALARPVLILIGMTIAGLVLALLSFRKRLV